MKESQKQNRNSMFSVITKDKQKTGVNRRLTLKQCRMKIYSRKKFNKFLYIQPELNNIAKLKGTLKRSENWEILVSNMAAGFGGGVTETENGGKGTMRYAGHVPGKARACSSS